jgi:GNAT superfamily N-acetyltransferase
MSLEIRPARAAESDDVVAFQLALARESEGLELDRTTVARGVAAVFADPTKGQYWVAEENGRPLGCLLITTEWSDWRDGTVLWIQGVYIVPEARGQGVYRALHEAQRQRVVTSPDLRGLRLSVARGNTGAQEVYRRLGMSGDHYLLCEWFK